MTDLKAIRLIAIEHAINANCGQTYDTDSNVMYEHKRILEAAKAFEEYLKGEGNV